MRGKNLTGRVKRVAKVLAPVLPAVLPVQYLDFARFDDQDGQPVYELVRERPGPARLRPKVYIDFGELEQAAKEIEDSPLPAGELAGAGSEFEEFNQYDN